MNQPPSGFGYSAEVELNLQLGDRVISLHAVGPERVKLREPIDAPPGPAEVIVIVDGDEERTPVMLPDGLSRDSKYARTIRESASAKLPSRSA
jgi:hypothetical protein